MENCSFTGSNDIGEYHQHISPPPASKRDAIPSCLRSMLMRVGRLPRVTDSEPRLAVRTPSVSSHCLCYEHNKHVHLHLRVSSACAAASEARWFDTEVKVLILIVQLAAITDAEYVIYTVKTRLHYGTNV
jgi:hypothetical protein